MRQLQARNQDFAEGIWTKSENSFVWKNGSIRWRAEQNGPTQA